MLRNPLAGALAAALLAAAPVCAQYPGQVAKGGKEVPTLRAIGVLEWTGDPGSPKASRLVPISVLDGGELQDGAIYMARPQPLALTSGVEYELQENGKPLGLYDIQSAGQQQGSWIGFGSWKPIAVPKPKPSMSEVARTGFDPDDDKPVLHRKRHSGDAPSGTAPKDGSPAPAADPDRPTLHKKDSGAAPAPTADTDPDRPTLHKKPSTDASAPTLPDDDPDRPTLKRSKKSAPADIGHVDNLPEVTDPDRPRLKRGQSTGGGPVVLPSLMGLPSEMQQTVAVSDAKSRTEHPWTYAWASPGDEEKMKAALEQIARDALGLKPPPPPPAPRRTARKSARPAPPAPVPEPPPLFDEQFRVFELTYGSSATLVLTARTDGPADQQRFVTLIAQPDLYGNVLVLLKNVADGSRLDETPRMRLIDAVDALADNRGELLFELRGATQRQFALYRVLRGLAEKLFVSGGAEFGTESR